MGPYPECAIVGPPSPLTHEHASSRLSYAFNAASRNIVVTAASIGSSRTTQAAIWDLVDQRRGQVEHVSLFVLADKLDLLSTLRSPYQADERRRFYTGAYLPAWYEEGGRRYDAVYLAACLDDRAPTMHGIEDAVAEFRVLFQD